MTNFRTTKLKSLTRRYQSLDDIVHRLQESHDRETRVEEKIRLEPQLEEKKRERDTVEAQILQLEAEIARTGASANAAVPEVSSRGASGTSVPSPAAPSSPSSPLPSAAPCLFYSYAREDEALRDELAKHLKILERQGILSSWHDRNIAPGTDWDHDISDQLLEADIILLLISADFLASDYIWAKELGIALERHQRGEARVIPVILRECEWTKSSFSHLQALPRDARPVTSWPNQDEAFTDIARALRKVANG